MRDEAMTDNYKLKCPECGQDMEHICAMVCVDICWPCEWRKNPGMKPRRALEPRP